MSFLSLSNITFFFGIPFSLEQISSSISVNCLDDLHISDTMGHIDARTEVDPHPHSSGSYGQINVSDMRTIKVSNISRAASEKDIKEFLCFSGDIQYIEMQRDTEDTQLAYVTFKDSQGADRAMLLSGTTVAGLSVSLTTVENYQLPPDAFPTELETTPNAMGSTYRKAEDVVSTMLAKSFLLGKDTLNKAKSFDEQRQLTSNATAMAASIDRRIGLSEKLSIGTAVINEKVKQVDEQLQVSEKAKTAYVVAEKKASSTGSAIMSIPYVSIGASWFSSAFSAVVKAAEDLNTMTKEKIERAEEERNMIVYRKEEAIVSDFERTSLDETPSGELPVTSVNSSDENKLGNV